jgi:hypothetical protein
MIITIGKATEHFLWSKARCKGADKIGCCSGFPTDEEMLRTLLQTIQMFEAFRWFVSMCCAREVMLLENSIYRCEIWNSHKEVGGSPDSRHKKCLAGDLDPRYADTRRRVPIPKFAGMGRVFGFSGIIAHSTFAHFDRDPNRVYHKNVIFPYAIPREFERLLLSRN